MKFKLNFHEKINQKDCWQSLIDHKERSYSLDFVNNTEKELPLIYGY